VAVRWYQDPSAILDYTLDWTKILVPGDSLAHVTFIPDPGMNVLSENITNSTVTSQPNLAATVWLLGGTVGQTYKIACHITTEGGRQDDRTFNITIKER
jgi:hypothetical protein